MSITRLLRACHQTEDTENSVQGWTQLSFWNFGHFRGGLFRARCAPAETETTRINNRAKNPKTREEFGGGRKANWISPMLWFWLRICLVIWTEADAGCAALTR